MKNELDFICIGAPKSATSTLFELIKDHPGIYIPAAKEVPFFNDDEIFNKGWKWYLKTFFSDGKKDQVWGAITPQYMSGLGANTPERICERIQEQLPKCKIIILLRNPIGRSYSQFKMHKRFGYIDESFEESVNRLLDNSDIEEERRNLSQKNMFLFASEYGRILSSYYKAFPRNNILTIFTDDLKKDPGGTLKRLFGFLDVDSSFKPEDMARQSHRGGGKAKIKYLTPAYLKKMPPVDFLWRKLVPITLRKRIFMFITRWNIREDNERLETDDVAYKKLIDYFAEDIKQLESTLQKKVPWKEWS